MTLIIRKRMVLMRDFVVLSPFHFWVSPLSSAPKASSLSPVICCDHETREAALKVNTHLIPKWDWRWAQRQCYTGMGTISLWLNRKISSPGQCGKKKKINQSFVEKRSSKDHMHEICHALSNHPRILILWLSSSSLSLAWKLSIPRATSHFSKNYHESGGSNSLKQSLC